MKDFLNISHLLGISNDRIVVQQDVFADEVYLPRYGGCQDPVYNTWEILSMREYFLPQQEITTFLPRKPVILLMTRSPSSGFGRNKGDPVRQWSPEFIARFEEQLIANFPSYEVKIFSDTDSDIMGCLKCHAKIFAEADILIGVHGAGFANQIYMKPNRWHHHFIQLIFAVLLLRYAPLETMEDALLLVDLSVGLRLSSPITISSTCLPMKSSDGSNDQVNST